MDSNAKSSGKGKDKCPFHPITIPGQRKIINCDKLKFPWKCDKKGYFLVKLEKGKICCGFVNKDHVMTIEFRGKDSDKMMKEIARRKLCSHHHHMSYIASELMRAQHCLDLKKKYVQR